MQMEKIIGSNVIISLFIVLILVIFKCVNTLDCAFIIMVELDTAEKLSCVLSLLLMKQPH